MKQTSLFHFQLWLRILICLRGWHSSFGGFLQRMNQQVSTCMIVLCGTLFGVRTKMCYVDSDLNRSRSSIIVLKSTSLHISRENRHDWQWLSNKRRSKTILIIFCWIQTMRNSTLSQILSLELCKLNSSPLASQGTHNLE